MKKLLIINDVNCHYEILESVILKYSIILNIDETIPIEIYLYFKNNKIFKKYIKLKYPKIKLKKINNYDYYINCTAHEKDYKKFSFEKNKKYISHRVNKKMLDHPNVLFLTPLSKVRYIYADILPFSDKKIISDKPIYIIQGAMCRRYLPLLIRILDEKYKYDFFIKIICKDSFPNILKKYKSKIIFKSNLNFINYHVQFTNAYCILPLITKKSKPQYYNTTLTSSINYARGYKLKCLLDKDLQDIYNLENVEIFNDINDIIPAFKQTLEDFYSDTKNKL